MALLDVHQPFLFIFRIKPNKMSNHLALCPLWGGGIRPLYRLYTAVRVFQKKEEAPAWRAPGPDESGGWEEWKESEPLMDKPVPICNVRLLAITGNVSAFWSPRSVLVVGHMIVLYVRCFKRHVIWNIINRETVTHWSCSSIV